MDTARRQIGLSTVTVVQGDITQQRTQAIVNAANSSLMGGGGVDGAIHRAGGPAILENCKRIVARQGRLPTGKAVITTAGNLFADYVIHTVGPVWKGGQKNEAALLSDCYANSLNLAEDNRIAAISFPSISTGAFGYPVQEAARVAMETVRKHLETTQVIKEVVFVLFDGQTLAVYQEALTDLEL